MVNPSVSNDTRLEWLKSIKDFLPFSPSFVNGKSDEYINNLLSELGLPPLYTDLSGAPLHDREAFDNWIRTGQGGASSPSLSQLGRSVSGGNGSSDRDTSNLGQSSDHRDDNYNNLRIDTSVGGSSDPDGNTSHLPTDPMPYPHDREIIDGDGSISNPYDSWVNDQYSSDSTWFERIFGTSFQTLVQSIVSKYTDASVTGGEIVRNQWDLDKMNISNEFSAQQTEISRDWQEQMYNKYNSLSGKIAQAEQSGVNPLFAVTGNAVSPMSISSGSPSGAVASGSGQKSSSDLLSSLASLLGLKAQIRKTDAETRHIEANTDISLKKLGAELANLQSSTDLNLQKVIESATSIEKIKSDINLNDYHADLFAEQVQYLVAQANYINAIKEPERRLKVAQATLAEWQDKNKALFKGLEVGSDVLSILSSIGIGIFNAKTGRLFTDSPVVVPEGATVVKPSSIAF